MLKKGGIAKTAVFDYFGGFVGKKTVFGNYEYFSLFLVDIKTLPKKNYDPIFKNGQSGAVLNIRRPAAKKRLNSILDVTAAIDNNSNLSEKSPKKKLSLYLL